MRGACYTRVAHTYKYPCMFRKEIALSMTRCIAATVRWEKSYFDVNITIRTSVVCRFLTITNEASGSASSLGQEVRRTFQTRVVQHSKIEA